MESQVVYRYGWTSSVWRLVVGFFLIGAVVCAIYGARLGSVWLLVMATVLGAPALFFGTVVAVRIERTNPGQLIVTNLLGVRRRIARERVGTPKTRETYENDSGQFYAPRCWIPIASGAPIYVDLLGEIPDRNALASALGIPPTAMPR